MCFDAESGRELFRIKTVIQRRARDYKGGPDNEEGDQEEECPTRDETDQGEENPSKKRKTEAKDMKESKR